MGWLAFFASVIHSLAWPTAVVIGLVTFRTAVGNAIETRITRFKAAGIEVELN